jgi:hypothetical protein
VGWIDLAWDIVEWWALQIAYCDIVDVSKDKYAAFMKNWGMYPKNSQNNR